METNYIITGVVIVVFVAALVYLKLNHRKKGAQGSGTGGGGGGDRPNVSKD